MDTALASTHAFGRGYQLAAHASTIDRIFLITDGFACRYRMLPDGRRCILSLLLPGDLCEARSFGGRGLDHWVGTLSPVRTAILTPETMRQLSLFPTLARTFAENLLLQEAISREWLLNRGHRDARQRLSHFICEIFERLRAMGLATEDSFPLPLMQKDFADALALTPVHVNRILQELRRLDLIYFGRGQLIIYDYPALQALGDFDPTYIRPATARVLSSEPA